MIKKDTLIDEESIQLNLKAIGKLLTLVYMTDKICNIIII